MNAQINLTLIPELETESFEYAIGADNLFFKMKTESNWHHLRASTLLSQFKTLHQEINTLKTLLGIQNIIQPQTA